ncbi:ATP-binding cassette domain-containing protein [Candidatus Peregrinibacteria bacterium]|nr:ATP-binding cassette domain-containing protein [Candidatus Peregrinibacteria bacterium]
MISVKHLTKNYGNFRAVDDISFEIKKGEIVGFLGPNGAGKTTTMKILTCFLPASSGSVQIGGMDTLEMSTEIRKRIGYLPENTPLYEDMDVLEYLQFLAEMHRISKNKRIPLIKDVIESCGLKSKIRAEIGTLSKGYRQRVGLAQALIHNPSILILDEPTSGLDPNQIIEIRNLIKDIGKEKTIILSTHILSEVEGTCNRVLIIHKGKIVAEGSPGELRNQAQKRTIIRVQVEGSASAVISALKELNGIEKVKKLESNESGVCSLDIETSEGLDIRKNLNHFFLDRGFELVGMQREIVSLEDVFTHLTRN